MSESLRRPRRGKREVEELLVGEFLEHIGVAGAQIDKRESPDFLVRCAIGGGQRVVGIELTEYQRDREVVGGSPTRRIWELEERIMGLAQRRCIAAVPQFTRLEVRLTLARSNPPTKGHVELVAGELVDFLPPRYFVWVTWAMAGNLKSSFPAIR